MRRFLQTIAILFLFVGFLSSVQSAYALVCCGTFNCTKKVGDTIVDNYTVQCGCQNDQCPSGYEKSGTCQMKTSCGSGGTLTCSCGVKADGSGCKPCPNSSCFEGAINCPAGTVKGTVVESTLCSRQENTFYDICSLGSAQTQTTTCCSGQWKDSDNCWVTPSGVTRCEQYYECRGWTINNYNCVPTCTASAPTNISVTQGSASATTANVSWVVGSGGTSQRLYVDESEAEVNNGCTTPNACEVSATLASGTNSYPVLGLDPATTYYFRVVTYADSSCQAGATVSYRTPDLTLAGRVYFDENNNCSTANPWSLGGLNVSVQNTAYAGSVASDGRFGFYGGDTSPVNLVLSGYPAGYIPSTAVGCNSGSTLTSVTNPSTTNYFYLTLSREAWWQVVGGSVYANGNVRSEMPPGARLIAPAGSGAYGALIRSSGSVDTGAGEISTLGYSAMSNYRGKRMDYSYFAAHMGVTPNTTNDWAADTMNKPANNPNKVFYYINPSGSEASVSTPWTVGAGESYVVFVNGDLRIASSISVAPGGFLAFIVNGSLRVSPAVTHVAGLYVIDDNLITETNGTTDVIFYGQGSFVSWGGVNFGRELGSGNLSTPAESFVFRPDLLVNMPDEMKVFALKWEEVVPGTF